MVKNYMLKEKRGSEGLRSEKREGRRPLWVLSGLMGGGGLGGERGGREGHGLGGERGVGGRVVGWRGERDERGSCGDH